MSKPADTTVKVESHGVEVDIDVSKLDDVRVTFAIAQGQDPRGDATSKMVAYMHLCDYLFGDALGVADRLAQANGGTASNEMFNEFLADVFEQVGAKNS